MTKFKWYWIEQRDGNEMLRHAKSGSLNHACVTPYPDLGYRVEIWEGSSNDGEWVELGLVPDLDAAKMIAQLNVEETFV